jgi:hypothetical protein
MRRRVTLQVCRMPVVLQPAGLTEAPDDVRTNRAGVQVQVAPAQ